MVAWSEKKEKTKEKPKRDGNEAEGEEEEEDVTWELETARRFSGVAGISS